jgi:hypothetical protein
LDPSKGINDDLLQIEREKCEKGFFEEYFKGDYKSLLLSATAIIAISFYFYRKHLK